MMKYIFSLFLFLSIDALAQSVVTAPFQSVNSEYDEQNPIIGPDALYFTVANHPQNIGGKKDLGDIWVSLRVNGAWSKPVHGGKVINNDAYNAVAGFSADGKQMFLLSHYKKNGATTTQGISVSQLTDYGWSSPENISIPYFMNRSNTLSGMVNAQGNIFVFAADSYGTFGAEDIYVSLKKNGKWTDPVNLGATINTSLQELTPAINEDGTILYFSSNGKKGEGGFDVFSSTRLDDTWGNWSKPVNLMQPINTEARELFYRVVTPNIALFTTTRNSDGYGDIGAWIDTLKTKSVDTLQKMIEVKRVSNSNRTIVSGQITDSKTGAKLAARLLFKSDSVYSTSSSADGKFTIEIPSNKNYSVEIDALGYVSLSEQLNLLSFDVNTFEMNFALQRIEVGAVVKLKNILFYMGTTSLLEESHSELDVVVQFLKSNPKVEIELQGHTDNRGDSKKNFELSQQRVDVIKKYLVSKGIPSKRISGKGFGGTRPIATNDLEESRKLNRRVEFVIVKD